MNKTNEFIELYKKLEDVVRDIYEINQKDSISYYLTKHTKYTRNRNEIRYCQNVRNFLQHNEKVRDDFAIEPSKEMIIFIKDLIEDIVNRPTCNDIAIKYKDIYYQSMEDDITEAMKVMRENSFTHVPILNQGIVEGVFDENVIFNYLSDNEIITVHGGKFKDLEKYLDPNNRELVEFYFVPPSTYVDELYKIFENKLKEGIRLGMIFITPSGSESEKITGIITPWDILGRGN